MKMESVYSGGEETKTEPVQIVNEPTDDPQYLCNLHPPERDFGKQAQPERDFGKHAQTWRRD